MTNVINLGDWIEKRKKRPLTLIDRFVRLVHAERAYEYQRRKRALDNIERSIKGDSVQPKSERTPDDAA